MSTSQPDTTHAPVAVPHAPSWRHAVIAIVVIVCLPFAASTAWPAPATLDAATTARPAVSAEALNKDLAAAASLESLAASDIGVGDYADAEALLTRALEIRERVLGPEHPDIAESLTRLARLYQAIYAYDKAETLLKRALSIREKVLGSDHPDTAASLDQLAKLYEAMAEYAKAEPLYKRALAIREKVLGPEHPDTSSTRDEIMELRKEVFIQLLRGDLRSIVGRRVEPQSSDTPQFDPSCGYDGWGWAYGYQRGRAGTTPRVTPAKPKSGLPSIFADEQSRSEQSQIPIDRYPTLETRREVRVGHEFSVSFSLTEQLLTPDVQVPQGTATPEGRLRLNLPDAGEQTWTIDVVLFADGFRFQGPDSAQIRLPRHGSSDAALFRLIPDPIDAPKASRTLFVTLWHKGLFLARVSRTIRVVNPSATRRADVPVAAAGAGADVEPSTPRPISVDLSLRPPELTLFVLHGKRRPTGDVAHVLIYSPYFQPLKFRVSLPSDTDGWLRGYFGELSRQGRGVVLTTSGGPPAATSPAQNVAYAKGFGRLVYQRLAPEPFKNALRELRRRLGSDFRSILILTDDPLIPWELMVPADGGEEAGFLGTDFRIARWHVAQDSQMLDRPPQRLVLQELAVIAPRYADRPLPQTAVELDALEGLPGFQAIPGRFEAVSRLFSPGELGSGIVHFAGHGTVHRVAPEVTEYAIELEDRPLDLMTWRGLTHANATAHPLYFFNACDLGQAQQVLNFVDGWAPAVLEAGASGYIGGLWPLSDRGAAAFAVHFYQRIAGALQSHAVNVAEALRATRKLFFDTGDPTFLAYVYYGDPNLYLTR